MAEAIDLVFWTIVPGFEKIENVMGNQVEEANQSPAQTPVVETRHLRNHFLWLGPLLTCAGAISYFAVFARFPVLRDFPWANLPLVLVGVIVAMMSLMRAFNKASAYRGKMLGSAGLVFSLFVGGLFCWYVFYYSYTVPPPTSVTTNLKIAPDFDLLDQQGHHVRLSDFRGRNVVLTFYRGFW